MNQLNRNPNNYLTISSDFYPTSEISEIRETVAKTAAKERQRGGGGHANGVAAADDDHYGRRCPFPILERHPSFPPLSDSVDVVFNEKQGRHVVARKVACSFDQ